MDFIIEIKEILHNARQKAYTAINFAMVEAYWFMGKRIVEEEQSGNEKAKYGESILKNLSQALTVEFGKGFSYANLRNFRQFYLTYPDQQICYTLCSKLSWSHNRLIMRVKNSDARNYYLNESFENNWSVSVLQRNINSFYYERLLSSKPQNEKNAISSHGNQPLIHFVKDPYVLEFLNIPNPNEISERELETALINNLQHFLLELGKGFSFVARQMRISTEMEHFFIDLVFYNYILKCFVIFDLKLGKLGHQDVGQMDMYVRMFDDLKRTEGDNPTVGIILCTEKSETIVKYSVLNENSQLFASKYSLYLPTEAELIAEVEHIKQLTSKNVNNE